MREARKILGAALEGGGGVAMAVPCLVGAAPDLLHWMEAAPELRARTLLALQRYREVAEMFRDYIPS